MQPLTIHAPSWSANCSRPTATSGADIAVGDIVGPSRIDDGATQRAQRHKRAFLFERQFPVGKVDLETAGSDRVRARRAEKSGEASSLALAGGGAGVAAGSVLGALVGLGVPRDDAEKIEHDIDAGGIVVSVNTRDEDRGEVLQAMRTSHARNVVESAAVR